MKKVRNTLLALWLVASLLLATACATPAPSASPSTSPSASETTQPSASPEESTSDSQWFVSDIEGAVTAETTVDLKDDFHAAVNQDWLSTAEISAGQIQASSFTERNYEVMGQILTLFQDESQTSHEAKLVQQLYNDFLDMETRNALGMEPVMPMVEDIQDIHSLDDLTRYLSSEKDKISSMPVDATIMADWKDSTKNAIFIGPADFSLGDADEYRSITATGERKKEAESTLFQKLLMRVGYSQEEASSIDETFFQLENEIAQASLGSSASQEEGYRESLYNPVTMDELEEISPNFPIGTLLKMYTDNGIDRFILTEPAWLEKLNELYTEDNVEAFKAYLLYSTLKGSLPYLDQECLDLLDEYSSTIAGTTIHSNLEETAYSICSGLLNMAVGKMYAENYVTEETKTNVENLISQVVEVYRNRLRNMDWLSEETRSAAIEKLDSLKVRVAYPDDWSLYDYSDLTFLTKEEGGTLLTHVMALIEKNQNHAVEKAKSEVNSDMWPMSPQTVNATYMMTDNSINIPAGILGGDFYDPNASIEEQMGSIGMIIGHEITHGFDTNGSQYDKDGNLDNWWTEEDRAAFQERTAKVSDYFSQFEVTPGIFVNGQLTIGETVADLGGVSCMLEIARGIEDFDYQTFFTSFARIWKCIEPAATLEMIVQTDAHPPGYLRTNAIVQQCQEFYDAFDIQEGDGMYLPPEERLSVW